MDKIGENANIKKENRVLARLPIGNKTSEIIADSDVFANPEKANAIQSLKGGSYSSDCIATRFFDDLLPTLSSDVYLWQSVLSLADVRLTPADLRRLAVKGNVYLDCVFHEKNPGGLSASLFCPSIRYRDKNDSSAATFMFHDFHTGENYAIVEIYHAISHKKEPERFKPGSLKAVAAFTEFCDWIEESKITTVYGAMFDNWRAAFEKNLADEMATKPIARNAFFRTIFNLILPVLLDIARKNANTCRPEFIASVRYVASLAGFSESRIIEVNRAMNFLVLAGILKKGESKRLRGGDDEASRDTYQYSINFETTSKQLIAAWETIEELGLGSVRTFTKSNIARAFGKEKADEIIRRRPEPSEAKPSEAKPARKQVITKRRKYGDIFKPWGGLATVTTSAEGDVWPPGD